MVEHQVEAYQFFSRSSFPLGILGSLKVASQERPDIKYVLEFSYAKKPFELSVAELRPQRPTIGAMQYVDPDVDSYFEARWPMCIKISGTVEFPSRDVPAGVRQRQLEFLRVLLWDLPSSIPIPTIPPDQRASVRGYRREFFHHQFFDMFKNRRPCDRATFADTEVEEPIGPGLACFTDLAQLGDINEFVWSPILAFENRTTFEKDRSAIRQALDSLRKQYNGYSELADAKRHLRMLCATPIKARA